MPRPTNTASRRQQIVDALIAVMATRGYDGASVADIAREAGLAPGLVHYHFASKLEILVEAIRIIGARHEHVLEVAAARIGGRAPRSPRRELVAFIDVHLGLGAHADPALLACWVLVMGEALREPRVKAEVEAILARLVARATDILERGTANGELACADVPAAAAALIAVIQGYFAVAATARDLIPSGSAARTTLRMMEALVGAELGRRRAR